MLATTQSFDVLLKVITYNAAISACEKGTQWQQAHILETAARSNDNSPNVITISAASVRVRRVENGSRHLARWQWRKVLMWS